MHKLVISNSLPSKNSTVLIKEHAFLLYNIVHLNKFNLGQTIFDNMMTYVNQHTQKGSSLYLSLIAYFLEKMEFLRYIGEKISRFVASVGISSALKAGDRVVDLPTTSPTRQNLNVAQFVSKIPYITFLKAFVIYKLIAYKTR